MTQNPLDQTLENILQRYSLSFSLKVFSEESATEDDLMRVFGLTQLIKAENKQYWGRELGMCWQRVITEVCRENCEDFRTPIREGKSDAYEYIRNKTGFELESWLQARRNRYSIEP